jgi:hypothetical protein
MASPRRKSNGFALPRNRIRSELGSMSRLSGGYRLTSGEYRLTSGECRLRGKIMLKQFRIFIRVLALVALSASILSPPLRAEPTTKTLNLTPLDYPLSPSARSKLPPPQLPQPRQTGMPPAPPQVTGPHPSQQPGPPSPLLGKAPPLPLSLPMIHRFSDYRRIRRCCKSGRRGSTR